MEWNCFDLFNLKKEYFLKILINQESCEKEA